MTGAEFRALREQCQLSLRGLARIMRVHHMSVWRYETGRLPVPPQLAKLLAFMANTVQRCPLCQGSGIQKRS